MRWSCLLTAVGLLATGLIYFLALHQIKLTFSTVHLWTLFGQQPTWTDQILQNFWLSGSLRSFSVKCRHPGNSRTDRWRVQSLQDNVKVGLSCYSNGQFLCSVIPQKFLLSRDTYTRQSGLGGKKAWVLFECNGYFYVTWLGWEMPRLTGKILFQVSWWVFIGRTDVEAETLILWPPDVKSWLIGKDPDAGKDWGQEEKGTTEDETVGWHHRHNGHGFGWTPGVSDGQGGLVCCSPCGCKKLDMTEWLNWTDKDVSERD